jgi:hypothetical protein
MGRRQVSPEENTDDGGLHVNYSYPHFLDNRLTDGDEVVSLTRRPPFTPRKMYVCI